MIIFWHLISILFTLFALCSCKDNCMKKKANQCRDKMFDAKMKKQTLTKSELREEFQNCYRDSKIECGHMYEKFEDKYCYLDDLGNEKCPDSEPKDDIESCLEKYMGYMESCAVETLVDSYEVSLEQGRNGEILKDHIDANVFICGAGVVIAKCMLDRAEERCGEAARKSLKKVVEQEFGDIVDSCNKAHPLQVDLLEMTLLYMQQNENMENLKE